MFKNTSLIKKIKTFCDDLDKEYGKSKNNKKDLIFGFIIFLGVLIYSIYMVYNSLNEVFTLILFLYLMAIIFTTLLIIIFEYLYYNPKNNVENKKKKTFLKFSFLITIFLFFVMSSPVLILIFCVDKISRLLGIQIFTRNIHVVLLESFIYVFAYVLCIENNQIYKFNIITYLSFVSFIWFIAYGLRKLIYKIINFFSYREKYEYLYKSRSALIYIINILSIFSSVCGLYISKYNNAEITSVVIFYIMPIIIFSGLEQIFLYNKQNKNERIELIQNLYEELVVIHDIVLPQIADFSCIKIRIKLSIKSYAIETYKNYFFSQNKKDNRIIIEILDACKDMLEKEYCTYNKQEKLIFENDLFRNIDNLAMCLTTMK